MEEALYHPKHGFYALGLTRTGGHGDFLTPVSPGPVLGQLLALQVDELYRTLHHPPRFRIIEQGADAGWLIRDLAQAILLHHPTLAQAMELHLVEPHPRWAERQDKTLRESNLQDKTQWHRSWDTVPEDEFPCFFYSCELVDSFPVRIFRYRGGAWREQVVGYENSHLLWQEAGVGADLLKVIREEAPPEVEGFTLELRPSSQGWVRQWATRIRKGMTVTLDYGYSTGERFTPAYAGGTCVALRQHRRCRDLLDDPGEQDLTAHVNFGELENFAAEAGWKNYGQTDFARGLTALASRGFRENPILSETWIRNFRHLTHPSFFGMTHKILVQGKSLPENFHPTLLGGG